MKVLIFTLGLLAALALSQDVKITDAERTVDISSQVFLHHCLLLQYCFQLAKVNVALTVQNNGKSALSDVLFYITTDEAAHLAHIAATIKKKDVKVQVYWLQSKLTQYISSAPISGPRIRSVQSGTA